MSLQYTRIEEQLIEALPELHPAAERYWRAEGVPGEDCGAYIFIESMFVTYLQVLLALDESPVRNDLLRRAFGFIDEMLRSDHPEIVNLAVVGIFEGRAPWWWARAKPYFANQTLRQLDRFEPGWRAFASSGEKPTLHEKGEIIDLYGVRSVIAARLAVDGISLEEVPGTTYSQH